MATVDYFLRLDGIEGESRDAAHPGEIELSSWSWGASNSGTMQFGGSGGGGRAQVDNFDFTMRVNKATPKLIQKLVSGEHIPKATLTGRKTDKTPHEYLIVIFEEIIVASYRTGGSPNDDAIPDDSVSLNFAKFNFEYREHREDGSSGNPVAVSYDLKKNRTL